MKNKKMENLLEMAQLCHGLDRLSQNVKNYDPALKVQMKILSVKALNVATEVMEYVRNDIDNE